MLEKENIQNKTNNSTALTLLASSNMAVPSDVRFIKPFLNLQRMVVDMGRAILQRPDLTPETYKKVFSETQKSAEKILLAELKMGEYLKSLPTAQGKRTDLKDELSSTEAYKSKKEAIEAMGISAHVAFDMQNLTPEAVNSAIEKARDKHLLVNRKMAKEFITDKKRENNTKLTDFEGISQGILTINL